LAERSQIVLASIADRRRCIAMSNDIRILRR
jgi:hypothetical protein